MGLDEKDFKEALEHRRYREVHQRMLHHAYNEVGINAVPTFIIGESVLQGLYSEEMLRDVIDRELG
ncbi:thioredoxin domain-containing protein [Fonticella tunisiensis]|uniref:Thioredoxin-like protein n=1 Tax=Fonticella tunisiensis TaxID=1096341 RepID=A0A4V3ETL4_9CLOT|nr:thioredoxin domain-containing protein [Fonticella tunisiensis]TDT62764.1 thioredoxin-like protein [Fonticella tunisiensis]